MFSIGSIKTKAGDQRRIWPEQKHWRWTKSCALRSRLARLLWRTTEAEVRQARAAVRNPWVLPRDYPLHTYVSPLPCLKPRRFQLSIARWEARANYNRNDEATDLAPQNAVKQWKITSTCGVEKLRKYDRVSKKHRHGRDGLKHHKRHRSIETPDY